MTSCVRRSDGKYQVAVDHDLWPDARCPMPIERLLLQVEE